MIILQSCNSTWRCCTCGCIIEKHFTDIGRVADHTFYGPGSWREMVSRTRELENALGSGIKRVEDNERETAVPQRRSVCFVDALPRIFH